MVYIPVKDLNESFKVSAMFYHAEVNNERFLMRREARISRKGSIQSKVDAVVVMVNPGSCQPETEMGHTQLEKIEMLPAKSDPTQHQLMRLMERMDWNELIIVNLSDICEGNLKKFKEIEQKFKSAGIPHSIFQNDNSVERDELLANADYLIFAWGGSNNAKRMAKEYGLYDKGRQLAPYQHAISLNHIEKQYPRHPKPALISNQIEWLENLIPLL
ncbi:DUF1643 domain-containing protein [Planococcus faecalis]|uniref:DUF1643 domain-containing protein n=1 Tax=Planococcus faecalis TaxID=1598147 RepID=A0ABM6IPD9_9BACL|nr:DUF1643 domain-containing protein [Planococcus faecalis]AQU78444.1 hypothetical protein AJGP001_03640 [Planococcus faecalis]OHX52365.1 hypothetical protein BB777_11975 [Planococcus faecalis]